MNRKRKRDRGWAKRNEFPNWVYVDNMVMLHSTPIFITNFFNGVQF